MNDQLYKVLVKMGQVVDELPLTTRPTLTFGDITDIDLRKQTIFPIVHVNLGNASFSGASLNVVEVDMEIIVMDLLDVDKNKEPRQAADNPSSNAWFRDSSTNLVDVLNTTLFIENRIVSAFTRGAAFWEMVQMNTENVVLTPFVESFENNLAGWSCTITLQLPNFDVSVCSDGY